MKETLDTGYRDKNLPIYSAPGFAEYTGATICVTAQMEIPMRSCLITIKYPGVVER
jgi:hypothetical protein